MSLRQGYLQGNAVHAQGLWRKNGFCPQVLTDDKREAGRCCVGTLRRVYLAWPRQYIRPRCSLFPEKKYFCKVKYLCAILAFLVLTLSVQPVCIAGNVSNPDCCHDSNCAEQGQENTDDEGADDCTQCNPFQLCGCCAFSVVPPLLLTIQMSEKPVYFTDSWTIHNCPDIEEPVLGFWQPPKITA